MISNDLPFGNKPENQKYHKLDISLAPNVYDLLLSRLYCGEEDLDEVVKEEILEAVYQYLGISEDIDKVAKIKARENYMKDFIDNLEVSFEDELTDGVKYCLGVLHKNLENM